MIKGKVNIVTLNKEIDYESLGIPVPDGDVKETDYYFRIDNVYDVTHLEKDLYLVGFNDDTRYEIRLTETDIKKIAEI